MKTVMYQVPCTPNLGYAGTKPGLGGRFLVVLGDTCVYTGKHTFGLFREFVCLFCSRRTSQRFAVFCPNRAQRVSILRFFLFLFCLLASPPTPTESQGCRFFDRYWRTDQRSLPFTKVPYSTSPVHWPNTNLSLFHWSLRSTAYNTNITPLLPLGTLIPCRPDPTQTRVLQTAPGYIQ